LKQIKVRDNVYKKFELDESMQQLDYINDC